MNYSQLAERAKRLQYAIEEQSQKKGKNTDEIERELDQIACKLLEMGD